MLDPDIPPASDGDLRIPTAALLPTPFTTALTWLRNLLTRWLDAIEIT